VVGGFTKNPSAEVSRLTFPSSLPSLRKEGDGLMPPVYF